MRAEKGNETILVWVGCKGVHVGGGYVLDLNIMCRDLFDGFIQ